MAISAGIEHPQAGPALLPRVREVFETVSAAEPSVREAALDRECGQDRRLRDLVEGLLRADESAQPVLDRPLIGPASSGGTLVSGEAGPYRIVREIGAGGMGSVYLAVHKDNPEARQYALKVVRWPSPEFVQRLEQEIRILSRLEHPHIARLLDAGVTSAGLPFLAMEYVEGEPIHHYAERNQLSTPARVELFRQVCSAIRYLHQNLVVHRDLKPANILVAGDGKVKVVDFGIAKLLETDPGASTMTFGPLTPEYASPEQVRGEHISTLTDVYTLGVVLYQIVTGERPFQGGVLEVVRKVCEEEAPRPIGISSDLYTAAWKAMRKDPADRYASVEQLDDDLRRYLEGLPLLARGDSWRYRARKFVSRNRALVATAALLTAAIAAGIVGTAIEAHRAEHERVRAEATAAKAEQERLRAEANAAEAVKMRTEAERRVAEVEQIARGVVRAYGASVQPDSQGADALLAASARDSMIALNREGRLTPGMEPLLESASAELHGRDLAALKSWNVPTGWQAASDSPKDTRLGVDRQYLYRGKPSLFLQSVSHRASAAVVAYQEFSARQYQGKRVRFSAVVRTLKVEGSVILSLESRSSQPAYDPRQAYASGTGPWRPKDLVMDIPPNTQSIRFQILLNGPGTVWISNVDFREVPLSVPLTDPNPPHNLNFTSRD